MEKLPRFPELIKRHKIMSMGAIMVLAAGVVVGTEDYLKNRTYPVPEHSCTSPFAVSKSYVDHSITALQAKTDVGVTGLVAKGILPTGAYGVQVAFENPNEHGNDWAVSDMVKTKAGEHYAVKMGVGPGEVEFGVRVVAHQGSAACNTVPDVSFEHKGRAAYATAEAQNPWFSVVGNVLPHLIP